MLKKKELENKSLDELNTLYRELSKEIYEMKTEQSITRELEKPHLLREKKKDRARVMTTFNQKLRVKA